MANHFDTDNSDFLMGRDRMNKEDWLKQQEMEVAILDKVTAHLKLLRDAAAISSFPGGLRDFGIRKKQAYDHWVAGENAGSFGTTAIYRGPRLEVPTKFEPGMEDCGK